MRSFLEPTEVEPDIKKYQNTLNQRYSHFFSSTLSGVSHWYFSLT